MELNQSQVSLLKEMVARSAGDGGLQVILRPYPDGDNEAKQLLLARLNQDVDALLGLGLIEDVTGDLEKPPGWKHDFRVVSLTETGLMMFGVEHGTA